MSDRLQSLRIQRGVAAEIKLRRWADPAQTIPDPWPTGTYKAELRDVSMTDLGARGTLLATFTVDITNFPTEFALTLTAAQTAAIPDGQLVGFIDIIRTTATVPYPVLLTPIRVKISTTVTNPVGV